MGNLQFYRAQSIFENAWIDLESMPKDSFVSDQSHPYHNNAKVYAFNKNLLLIIADCNILLFNTNSQIYQKITKIPSYYTDNGYPPTIRGIDVSSFYNQDMYVENNYYFWIFQSHSDKLSIHQLSIDFELPIENNYDMNSIKCEWTDIKPKYMKNDKFVDLKCSQLCTDKYNNHLVFLFYIQIWPTRMLNIFDLKQQRMITKAIDSNKWFSISSMICLNNLKFLSFNNIGPELISIIHTNTKRINLNIF